MRAALGVDALLGQPQAFYRPAMDEMLFHDLGGILRPHMAIPDRFGIDHHRWPVLALVQAAGFVDAHLRPQPGSLGQLRQLRVKFALSISGAGRAEGAFRAHVMTNKHMVFKYGQTGDPPHSRLHAPPYPKNFPQSPPPHPPASAKMVVRL